MTDRFYTPHYNVRKAENCDSLDKLIDALAAQFGARPFDATDLVCAARHDPRLTAAIDAVKFSHARRASGYRRGDFNTNKIRIGLRRIRHDRLRATRNSGDYWSFEVVDRA
jgi:hypothetical protein